MRIVVTLLACLLWLPNAFAAIDAYQFDDLKNEQLFKDVIEELRCPKCQNQNISGSSAPIAKDIKDRVYKMIKQGKSKQEIIDHFIDRYGNYITYKPPMSGFTLILWIGPFIGLVLGLIVLTVLVKRISRQKTKHLTEQDKARLNQLMNEE